MFAAKEQNFKICNFSTRSLCVTLSQPIMIPNNFHFIESIPLLYREMLISETAVINIYIGSIPPPHLRIREGEYRLSYILLIARKNQAVRITQAAAGAVRPSVHVLGTTRSISSFKFQPRGGGACGTETEAEWRGGETETEPKCARNV